MVYFKKYSSAVTHRSPQKSFSTVSPREIQKRKGVPLEELNDVSGPSTSGSSPSSNKQWSSFRERSTRESNERRVSEEAELLALCNFYEDFEVPEQKRDDTDDDDSVPFALFEEQGMRMRYPPSLTFSKPQLSVSDLRMKSMLRISKAKVSSASVFESISEEVVEMTSAQEDDMEMAFQGGLSCSNSSQNAKKRRSIDEKIKKAEKEEAEAEKDDFWGDVEF